MVYGPEHNRVGWNRLRNMSWNIFAFRSRIVIDGIHGGAAAGYTRIQRTGA